MSAKVVAHLVREGDIVAEVDVELVEEPQAWAPYISVHDANKLDDVREALRAGDLRRAAKLAAHVYRLMPLSLTDAR